MINNVRSILRQELSNAGYVGLMNFYFGCGCPLEDLIPCGRDCSLCRPSKAQIRDLFYLDPDAPASGFMTCVRWHSAMKNK